MAEFRGIPNNSTFVGYSLAAIAEGVDRPWLGSYDGEELARFAPHADDVAAVRKSVQRGHFWAWVKRQPDGEDPEGDFIRDTREVRLQSVATGGRRADQYLGAVMEGLVEAQEVMVQLACKWRATQVS